MDALVLNANREAIAVLDTFESFIWTDRYIGQGDCEVYLPCTPNALETLQIGYYFQIRSSPRLMLIDKLEIITDPVDGDRLKVSGLSLESILNRRIIWDFTVVEGNFQEGVCKLLNENVISAPLAARRIPGFTFKASTDPKITALTIDTQLHGEDLYETIFSLCQERRIGFRVLPNGATDYIFELYNGEDRSLDQTANSTVIFSPQFDNLITSNYLESSRAFKNVTLIGGEGEGAERRTAIFGEASGLERREVFTDTNVSSKLEDDEIMPDAEYIQQLQQKGKEELAMFSITKAFEGEVDATHQFVYDVDFHIGDIVQVMNEYGKTAKARVSEVIRSHDTAGETMIPTFTFSE